MLDDSASLGEAREWLRERVEVGASCPCCTQFAKVYKRKLNSSMARAIIILRNAPSRISLARSDLRRGEWLHADHIIRASSVRSHDYIGLGYWKLIEAKPNDDDAKKKHSGWWRVTPEGVLFVDRQLEVPSHVRLYDGNVLGFSGKSVNIIDALGRHFDYSELMRA